MCQLFLPLQDLHTYIGDLPIGFDDLDLGVPLFVISGYYNDAKQDFPFREFHHFGAGLSPLPDSSLLVYDVVPDHPLGLQSGDVVLGYDNIPWKNLYKEILKTQLPIAYYPWLGSTEYSKRHHLLTSAGMNWHLFDTIDIVKYDSDDTLHLSTSILQNQQMQLFATAQMPINGVPRPDIENGHWVSWGIIDGTQIGYIYVWNWTKEGNGFHASGDDFRQAILTLMNEYNTSGLIIDSRRNTGGNFKEYPKGLEILFNIPQDIFGFSKRFNPNDHFSMNSINFSMNINADEKIYDKPIAVLTGPASASMGDFMPYQMRYHPMSKIFGFPSNGAFGTVGHSTLTYAPDWEVWVTVTNSYLKENPEKYLTHMNFDVDEEVWLTQEDVVKGKDTAVEKAIEWINNLAYAHDVKIDRINLKPNSDTVTITAGVENPNQNDLSVTAIATSVDSTKIDNWEMFNDGNHGDGAAGDSIWGAQWAPENEQSFILDVKTDDLISGTSRTLPSIGHFTSAGPVVLDDYTFVNPDTFVNPGEMFVLKLILKNEGLATKALNITVQLSSLDSFATVATNRDIAYGDIAAGESKNASNPIFGVFAINVANNCPSNTEIPLKVDIKSYGYIFWSDTFSVHIYPTGVAESEINIPTEFALFQNYPNPFNASTTFSYQIPAASHVELTIFCITGQKISTLISEQQGAGNHRFEWDGSDFASGVYFYRLMANDSKETGEIHSPSSGQGFVETRKLILLK